LAGTYWPSTRLVAQELAMAGRNPPPRFNIVEWRAVLAVTGDFDD
jgi:hypothetical protein